MTENNLSQKHNKKNIDKNDKKNSYDVERFNDWNSKWGICKATNWGNYPYW